ncbi:MAG: SpaA isopeptide-forming pilin-related protein [Eubacteriales bacterium]|nr:SpaA isopeptide-forming pilin-related protein [Eubacteriales bacterium]
MSKGKKILAVLLTAIMTVAMAVTALAAGTQSRITISGTGIDQTANVKYEQIIKEDPQSIYGWQFTNDAIKTAFVNGWNSVGAGTLDADGVIAAMIAADMIENPANVHVTAGTINPSANFNAAVAAVAKADPSLLTKSMSNIGTAENVEIGANVSGTGAGLYIVTAQKEGYTYLPMAAYMSFAGDDVAIQAKGSTDQINKVVAESGKSVAPGAEVDYTITQQYLYIAPQASDKTFTITDTLTNGTIKTDTVKVYVVDSIDKVSGVSDTDLLASGKYSITFEPASANDKTIFTVDFSGDKYDSALAGKTVVIKYSAIAGAVTTNAPLTNNVASSNGTGKIVNTKPVSFEVTKVEKGDNEDQTKVLSGAKFQIYKAVDKDTANAKELTLEDGTKVYGLAVGAEITTDTNGKASVNNLDAQVTYYVKETQAPAGYSLNDTAYELKGAAAKEDTTETIKDNGVTYTVVTHNFSDFNGQTITDTKLANLPSTGGIGTTIFTAAGCLIMICAAVFLFASRRRFSK